MSSSQPREGSSEAVTDDADFLARRSGRELHRRRDIEHHFLRVEFMRDRDSFLHVLLFVAELESGLHAIKNGGSYREESVFRIAVCHVADVRI